MKLSIFASLVAIAAAAPTAQPELVQRDPQFGGLISSIGNIGGSILGGALGSVVTIPLSLVGGLTNGLLGGALEGVGDLLGSILPFRVVQNEKGELVGVLDQGVVEAIQRAVAEQKQ